MKKLILIVFIGTFSFLILSSEETIAFESTYEPGNSGDILIENARILTGTGNEILRGSILISSNKIKAIGKDLNKPVSTEIIDANGKWVTPGIIDIHSHMGVYPAPGLRSSSDGNESTSPVTVSYTHLTLPTIYSV